MQSFLMLRWISFRHGNLSRVPLFGTRRTDFQTFLDIELHATRTVSPSMTVLSLSLHDRSSPRAA